MGRVGIRVAMRNGMASIRSYDEQLLRWRVTLAVRCWMGWRMIDDMEFIKPHNVRL